LENASGFVEERRSDHAPILSEGCAKYRDDEFLTAATPGGAFGDRPIFSVAGHSIAVWSVEASIADFWSFFPKPERIHQAGLPRRSALNQLKQSRVRFDRASMH
jgi:hypothetical protein